MLSGGLFANGSATAADSSTGNIEVLLNAQKIQFPDAKPYQDAQGSVMVPIRFVSEALGAEVDWEKANGQMTVSVQNEQHTVQMTVGQKVAKVDGQDKTYGTKIELKQNRTFVPLRLVSEGLGQPVEWDKIGRWVWIGKKEALTLEELGLKPVDIGPYKKYFSGKKFYYENGRDGKPYDKVLIFKRSNLPAAFLDDFYSIDYVVEQGGAAYIKARTKTKTETPGNIFFLTKDNKPRSRNPVFNKTINNQDGTKTFFFPLISWLDELDGIKNYKSLKINDVLYIGFDLASKDYIPLMENSWK